MNVLFVCVHNAGRSQMAEAIVKHIASTNNLPIKSMSAGTIAGEKINPVAIQVMDEIGISMKGQTPKQLTSEMVKNADKVITMGCGVDADACPVKFLISEDWGLQDPKGQSVDTVRAIRDQIIDRCNLLVEELTHAGK